MSKLSLQEIIFLFKIVGYIFGGSGILLVLSWGLVSYIFTSHRKQNTDEHRELFKKTDYHGEKISELSNEMKNAVKDFDRLQNKHDRIHK